MGGGDALTGTVGDTALDTSIERKPTWDITDIFPSISILILNQSQAHKCVQSLHKSVGGCNTRR